MKPENIRDRLAELRAATPHLRARNAADAMGVSEGELLAAQVGPSVVRLDDDPCEILRSLEPLGEVMALTRNESCVHERKGVYAGASFNTHGGATIGLFVNPDIDLRLFMDHWAHAFAVEEGGRHSLQFFDKAGEAVHKIYVTDATDKAAYDAVVARFAADDQSDAMAVEAHDAKTADRPDADIDWTAFRDAWEAMGDVHNFFPMLRKFKVGREQAFRNVGPDYAYEVDGDAARLALDLARDRNCEIMVFVGNRGCIQIHTGPVEKLVEHGPWYNVLDPKFNLHLNEERIARTWVTRKPTDDGTITAVEMFDADGEQIATFFGKRKPGIPELELWREIVAEIPRKAIVHAAQ